MSHLVGGKRPRPADESCDIVSLLKTVRPSSPSPLHSSVGVENAILYLLHWAHSHLDKGSDTVGIVF